MSERRVIDWLEGGGKMGRLIGSLDWGADTAGADRVVAAESADYGQPVARFEFPDQHHLGSGA